MDSFHILVASATLIGLFVLYRQRSGLRSIFAEMNLLQQRAREVSAPFLVGRQQELTSKIDAALGDLRRGSGSASAFRARLRLLKKNIEKLEAEQRAFEEAIAARNALSNLPAQLEQHSEDSDMGELRDAVREALAEVNKLMNEGRFEEARDRAIFEKKRFDRQQVNVERFSSGLRNLEERSRVLLKEALAGNAPVLMHTEWQQLITRDREVKQLVKSGRIEKAHAIAVQVRSDAEALVDELAQMLGRQFEATLSAATSSLVDLHNWPPDDSAQLKRVQALETLLASLGKSSESKPSSLQERLKQVEGIADKCVELSKLHQECWAEHMAEVREQFSSGPRLPGSDAELPEDLRQRLEALRQRRAAVSIDLDSNSSYTVAAEALDILDKEREAAATLAQLGESLSHELESLPKSIEIIRQLPPESGILARHVRDFEQRVERLKQDIVQQNYSAVRSGLDEFEADLSQAMEDGRLRCLDAAHSHLQTMEKVLTELVRENLVQEVGITAQRLERDIGMLQKAIEAKDVVDALLVSKLWTDQAPMVLDSAWRRKLNHRLKSAQEIVANLRHAPPPEGLTRERVRELDKRLDTLKMHWLRREYRDVRDGLSEVELELSMV